MPKFMLWIANYLSPEFISHNVIIDRFLRASHYFTSKLHMYQIIIIRGEHERAPHLIIQQKCTQLCVRLSKLDTMGMCVEHLVPMIVFIAHVQHNLAWTSLLRDSEAWRQKSVTNSLGRIELKNAHVTGLEDNERDRQDRGYEWHNCGWRCGHNRQVDQHYMLNSSHWSAAHMCSIGTQRANAHLPNDHHVHHTSTIESTITPPPLLCMLALGKTGEGAYSRDSDIYM